VVVIPDFGEGLETLDRIHRPPRPQSAVPTSWIRSSSRSPPLRGLARPYVRVASRTLGPLEMLMGIANLTELTDADSTGVNALLIGSAGLGIRHVLTTESSMGARRGARGRRGPPVHVRATARRVIPKHHRRPPLDGEGRAAEVLDEPELRALQPRSPTRNFRIANTREANLRLQQPDLRPWRRYPGLVSTTCPCMTLSRLLPWQGAD